MNEPIHRRPRYPQPDPAPVLEAAKRNRANWLAAMAAVNSNGHLTEQDRAERQESDESQFALDSGEDQE